MTKPLTEKELFLRHFERELPTTLKVLRAFPADKMEYKPHEKSSTAQRLAWTFVLENTMSMAALKGPLDFGKGMPPAPSSMEEIISAYEKSAKDYIQTLKNLPDTRLEET